MVKIQPDFTEVHQRLTAANLPLTTTTEVQTTKGGEQYLKEKQGTGRQGRASGHLKGEQRLTLSCRPEVLTGYEAKRVGSVVLGQRAEEYHVRRKGPKGRDRSRPKGRRGSEVLGLVLGPKGR